MPTREEAIKTFAAMVRDIPVAMLTTTGMGRLRSRPMAAQRTVFDGELWFLTARAAGKTSEIRDRQAVHVTFVSPSDNRYVWASGTATIVDDPVALKKQWHVGYLPWLPGGPDDPTITLIKVHVEEAEYWDNAAGRMVLLDTFIQPGSSFRDVAPGMGI
ncbi:MAG TPA: pyridoxamine 5'-phosphate oxidase family protein [Vicinamibacterales bacterium]